MSSELNEMHTEATRNIAIIFHYLVHHARNVQFYHELRLSVGDDVGKFSELISRAQREFLRLKDSEEHRERIKEMKWPSEKDIEEAQKLHAKFGKKYIQIMLGIAAGACKWCFKEKEKGGVE